MNEVPRHYLGVWERKVLRVGSEPQDTRTRVFWLQTPHWHADVRVPADRPSFAGVASPADCSVQQLRWLVRQEAFAGITTVSGDRCWWHRMIDFRFRRSQDVGRMAFAGEQVEEFGVHADYYELWQRLPGTGTGARAWQDTAGPRRIACVAGDRFLFVRERPVWDAEAVRIQARIELGEASRVELEAFVDFEASFGRIEGDAARIELSTLPWREGAIAFTLSGLQREPWQPAGIGPVHAAVFEAAAGAS
ncbi:hypothetical protein [Ramlibacter sp.]|uniref:hypothetical protein n=1 Tax=Ramlibacter sp. TaxID=1917967 RepID=UPI00261A29F9|nr:hypothetical protein [Ramlibacter sp.]MDB5956097.1 hypothetical protein [Ramlibacter sp.]